MNKSILLLLTLALAGCEIFPEQDVSDDNRIIVTGTVVDSATSLPLAGASVALDIHYTSDNWDDPGTTSTVATVLTDAKGKFTLTYDDREGSIDDLTITKPFYHPIHPNIGYGKNNLKTLAMRPRPGFTARYALDNDGTDQGPQHLTAQIHNGTFTVNRFGDPLSALAFDKSQETYVTIPAQVPLWRQAWSFSMWFRLDSMPSRQDDAILFKYDGPFTGYEDVYMYVDNDDNQIKFYNGTKSTAFVTVDSLTWYHAAVTFDGSTVRLFVNGVEKVKTWFTTLDSSSATSYVIGNSQAGAKGTFYGAIDDLRLYDYRLAKYEVAAVYEEERHKH